MHVKYRNIALALFNTHIAPGMFSQIACNPTLKLIIWHVGCFFCIEKLFFGGWLSCAAVSKLRGRSPFWAEVESLSSHIPHVHTDVSTWEANAFFSVKRRYCWHIFKPRVEAGVPRPEIWEQAGPGWSWLGLVRLGWLEGWVVLKLWSQGAPPPQHTSKNTHPQE